MKAKWLLCNVGPTDRLESISYAIQEIDRQVQIISIKEAYQLAGETEDNPKDIITDLDQPSIRIFRGSINMSTFLRSKYPHWFGNWHSKNDYLCSHYYSYFSEDIMQQDYIMLPLYELVRKWDSIFDKFGVNDTLFIRPNSGEKEFNGSLVNKKNKDAWRVLSVETKNVLLDEMCVICKPVDIKRELRLIIGNKKVLDGSLYREVGSIYYDNIKNQPDCDQIIHYAENVLSKTHMVLPPVHCLDIAVTDSGYSVLEVGCFCCCGLYDCDMHKIALGVSEVAEQLYNE